MKLKGWPICVVGAALVTIGVFVITGASGLSVPDRWLSGFAIGTGLGWLAFYAGQG